MKMELVKSGADSESVLKVVIEREVIEVGSSQESSESGDEMGECW